MLTSELSKYRLLSLKEPSDKLLESLMEQVTEQAHKRAIAAHTRFFINLGNLVATAQSSGRIPKFSQSNIPSSSRTKK